MRRRYAFAMMFALLVLAVDCLSFPFLLGGARPYVEYTLYLPGWLGEQFLLFAMRTWGWPAVSAGTSSLGPHWSIALLVFNWLCYAGLGFILGLRVGTVLERRGRSRRSVS